MTSFEPRGGGGIASPPGSGFLATASLASRNVRPPFIQARPSLPVAGLKERHIGT